MGVVLVVLLAVMFGLACVMLYFGVWVERHHDDCPVCFGNGWQEWEHDGDEVCNICNGTGVLKL